MSNFNPTDDELMKAAMGDLGGAPPRPPQSPTSPVHPKPPTPPIPPIPPTPPQPLKPKAKKIPKAVPIIATVMAVVIVIAGISAALIGHNSEPKYYNDGDGYDENYVNDSSSNNDGIIPEKGDEADYYSASTLVVGDLVELGEYPQSKVTDTRLIAYLDDQSVNMTSIYDDDITYNYGDFEYEGVKYRRINWTRDSDIRYVRDHYEKDVNYYFVWEPIVWSVLGETGGQWQLFSRDIIDIKYMDLNPNNWADSERREWLSTSFINESFSKHEKSIIETVDTSEDVYSSQDKIYLLSATEATNGHFGFTIGDPFLNYADDDPNRACSLSDYSCFFISSDSCSYYLRTLEKFDDKGNACYYYVDSKEGDISTNTYGGGESYRKLGIRPACRIDKNAKLPI